MLPVDIRALVPHPEGTAVWVIETDGGLALPSVTIDADGPNDDLAPKLAALAKAHGIDSPFLRRVGLTKHDGRDLILKEFEPLPATGRRWLPLDELARLDLPEDLRPALATWTAYQRGAEYPEFRPAWTRPGWHASTRRWLTDQLTRRDIEPVGEPTLVQQWAISSVLKQPTREHGDHYLKSVFGSPGRAFWHEPALSATLAREHPGQVPAVTTIDSDRGLMLMPDMGITYVDEFPVERWDGGLRVLAEIQRHWANRRDELLALGCPDRDFATTADQLAAALADPLFADKLDPAVHKRVSELMPRWRQLLLDATQWPVPLSLSHGDFHPGNVGLRADGSTCVFDWSDGAWSHPFLDVEVYVRNSGEAQTRLWDVYLDHWTDYAPLSELRQLIPSVNLLGLLYRTVTYHGLLTNVDPDDRFVFGEFAELHWTKSLEAWDAMA
ncbi:phosphotransferase family protein [Stackebrandtia nassauensis]|uniref:Aminoglycoside phosphotransferase n=1 Tax=Stackebrandtia nassauensis (strain DSM 44728 / CIP 108903 / NRRL B-16338 / NBRC 102104 / LLR-40K-21) TaxID=446470 RepID=D3QAU5_STANL|nr:phosphotransferase [Stackebrandtia nassauensis]ADD44741.1 aminoglycoside phosphotransferase [Stackebrandtia nassauensis DSM 44728]